MNASRRPKRVAIYARVSTANGQTTKNQERELQDVAERHGWQVVEVYRDKGISGAKGRDQRPGLDKLLAAVASKEVDMVAAWSVDRLGRSLTDLLGVLQELHAKGVDLYLHQQGLDTSTPSGRAMFQMMGVFAEFERAMIRERVMAGLATGEGGRDAPRAAADRDERCRQGPGNPVRPRRRQEPADDRAEARCRPHDRRADLRRSRTMRRAAPRSPEVRPDYPGGDIH